MNYAELRERLQAEAAARIAARREAEAEADMCPSGVVAAVAFALIACAGGFALCWLSGHWGWVSL